MDATQHIDSEGQLHTCRFKIGAWVGVKFAGETEKPGKIESIAWDTTADDWCIGVSFRFEDGPKVLYYTGTPLYKIRWKKLNGRSVWEYA